GVMFKGMIRYLILSLGVFISGCSLFKIGENVAIATGEVDGKCILMFKPVGLVEPQNYYFREVNGNFSEIFTISPKAEKYNLSVNCQGKSILSTLVKYPEEADKLQLGKLAI
uniref:hypothetical protein n=1 Tax=Pseudoalteromonas sp. T1lg76 TaxID=2077103 RepID=UPI00131A2B84